MLEKIKYTNHLNESIQFGENGYYVDQSNVHNYTWNVINKNNHIAGFNKKVSTFSLPVIIIAQNSVDGIRLRNKLTEIVDADTQANKKGTLQIGDYYIPCNVSSSAKNDYLVSPNTMSVTLGISTDAKMWIKNQNTYFSPDANKPGEGLYLDFPYDFEYDFTNALIAQTINNSSYTAADFEIVIFGECANPVITIGDNVYALNYTVAAEDRVAINSLNKTITLIHSDGSKENVFNKRDKTKNIFKKIDRGVNNVSWPGDFNFGVTLFLGRSEPLWS